MEDPQQLQQQADDLELQRVLRGGQIAAAESKASAALPRVGRAVAQADDLALQKILAQPQPTAAHEAIMRDGGTDFATADKMVKSGAAAHVAHLPPAVPTAKAPIDQIAAQYEVLKASGDLAKLSPEDYAVFTAPLKAAHWEVGADYIKPPTEAPGAYPLWERQIAGQLKQGELPQGQAWYERSALGRTARKVFEPIGGMIEQGAKAAGESVMGTLKGDPFAQAKALKKLTIDPQLAELQRGYDMWEAQGGHDSPESIAHGLAGLIPFLGPVAASFGEKAGTGVGKVTAGDTRGWEDIIGSIPDAVMLAAPLITKGFEAMKSGVPAEQAMSDVASQLRPLLEKRLKETIAPEGTAGTGAKPRIVAERGTATPQEVTNARQRPQVLSQAGPPGEARGGVGSEAGNVAQEGAVSGVRGGEQGQGPQGEVIANAQEPIPQAIQREGAAGPAEAQADTGAGQIGETTANRQGEGQVATETRPLGFAQQLADHELPSGDAMTYEATPGKFFDANRAAARENITKMGDQGAEHYVTSEGGAWTDERMATAAMLIRKLDALGDIEGANRVASAAAQRALEAGRASAAADLGRLTPEGVLVTAQKVAKQRGVELSPELATEASQRGAEARATFENFTQVEREIDRNGGQKAVQAAAQGKKLNLADRLDAAATQARTRLAERQAKMREGSLKEFGSGGLSTEELLDYATIGAAKIARGAADFGKWSREMLAEYGDSIRPHLKAIFNASAEQWHSELKADRTAKLNRQVEAVQAATGLDQAAAKNLIAQRAAARAADGRAKMQLAQTLDKINGGSPILRGLKRGAFELSTLPQTIKTAFDLSMTLRQGGAFSITEPRLSAEAFKKSVKAFGSEKAYEVGVDYIASHPRFDQMRAADLRLDTLRAHPESVIGRSEFYPSEIGRRIPGVHQSARAAEMMMDTQRVEAFDKFAGELERKAAESGEAVTPEQYKGLARWINIWSGRAPQLGGKLGALTQVLPWWSPGWVYSRVQLLNPAYALSLPKGVRAIAFRKTAQLYGTYTAAAGVIAASNAMLPENQRLKVSFDPDDPDFFKAKGGWLGEHTRVSLLPPGTQPQARFIARVGKHAMLAALAEKQGDAKERTKQASEVGKTIERFNFSKLTPVVGTAYGLMFNKGKNYIGEPITPGKATEDIGEPMSVNDIIDAYKAEGLGGALKEAPASILGADVQIYKRPPVDPKKFKAMPMETAVDVYKRAAPEDKAKLRKQLIEKRDNALQHAKTIADRRRIMQEYQQAMQ